MNPHFEISCALCELLDLQQKDLHLNEQWDLEGFNIVYGVSVLTIDGRPRLVGKVLVSEWQKASTPYLKGVSIQIKERIAYYRRQQMSKSTALSTHVVSPWSATRGQQDVLLAAFDEFKATPEPVLEPDPPLPKLKKPERQKMIMEFFQARWNEWFEGFLLHPEKPRIQPLGWVVGVEKDVYRSAHRDVAMHIFLGYQVSPSTVGKDLHDLVKKKKLCCRGYGCALRWRLRVSEEFESSIQKYKDDHRERKAQYKRETLEMFKTLVSAKADDGHHHIYIPIVDARKLIERAFPEETAAMVEVVFDTPPELET